MTSRRFRQLSARWFEPLSMWLIIFGIFGISQPWSALLHRYGFTITLVGLVGFIVFSHVAPPPPEQPGRTSD